MKSKSLNLKQVLEALVQGKKIGCESFESEFYFYLHHNELLNHIGNRVSIAMLNYSDLCLWTPPPRVFKNFAEAHQWMAENTGHVVLAQLDTLANSTKYNHCCYRVDRHGTLLVRSLNSWNRVITLKLALASTMSEHPERYTNIKRLNKVFDPVLK